MVTLEAPQTGAAAIVALIPPQFLYRYRSATTSYFEEELRRAVDNCEVYLTNIAGVNDPFEALPALIENSPKEVREYIARFQAVFGKGVSISGTNYGEFAKNGRFKKGKLLKAIGPTLEGANVTISSLKFAVSSQRSKLKIACFSELWNSLLMWGHYGQSHTGICIEYQPIIQAAAEKKISPLAIEYTADRPIVSYIELMEHIASAKNENIQDFFDLERAQRTFNSLVMTKPKEWEYEAEWRVMDTGSGNAGYYHVSPMKPVSILLGANHSASTLDIVRKIVGRKLPIEQVTLDERRFALRRRLLSNV